MLMNRIFLVSLLLGLGWQLSAQKTNLINTAPEAWKENVTVVPLESSDDQSSYLIWVVDTVKPHYHADHTECIYVLEGQGTFYLGDQVMELQPGDFVMIPRGVIHSFKNKTSTKSKVLSVQTPKFDGKDRVWVEEQK